MDIIKYIKTTFLAFVIFLSPYEATIALAEPICEGSLPVDSAIVLNSDFSVLYAKNPYEHLPPASTTKLLTAIVALERLSPDELVTVSRNAALTPTVAPRLRAKETLSVNELLHFALMRSVNSAAVALAEAAAGSEENFAKLMNRKAASIGAENSLFVNASGLPGGTQYTTVYDLAIILREALKNPLIRDILGKKQEALHLSSGRRVLLENTDKLLWVSGELIGGKTGYTRKAGHCFVGAINTDKGTVYAAMLGASSRTHLWQSAGSLMGIDVSGAFERLMAQRHKAKPVLASYKKTSSKKINAKKSKGKKTQASLKKSDKKKTAKKSVKKQSAKQTVKKAVKKQTVKQASKKQTVKQASKKQHVKQAGRSVKTKKAAG